MATRRNPSLTIRRFGPIEHAALEFGDLTVLVGPQGAGKSLALQWLKLALDAEPIARSLEESGVDLRGISASQAVDVIFGEGMAQALQSDTQVMFDGRPVRPEIIGSRSWGSAGEAAKMSEGVMGFVTADVGKPRPAKVFVIPAHRALLLVDGWVAPFARHPVGTPVVVRLFAQALYEDLSRLGVGTLFPVEHAFAPEIHAQIDRGVFHGARVELRQHALRQRRLELLHAGEVGLPYMVWTAGQREFTPLMLGVRHVIPSADRAKLPGLDWVVIEEPELGLHPRAIMAVLAMVVDLLWRGYRVVLSTHSPLVLDFVWALRHYKHPKADPMLLGQAVGMQSPTMQEKLRAAVDAELRVYFMTHDDEHRVSSEDISNLSPSAESDAESFWGELTLFSTKLSDAVSEIPFQPTEDA